MINEIRLATELAAQLPIEGASVRDTADAARWPKATWHTRPAESKVVRVDWPGDHTSQQEQQADAIVQAHDGTPTLAEKLDDLAVPPRLVAALVRVVWCRSQVPPVAPPAWAVTLINQANAWVVNQGG